MRRRILATVVLATLLGLAPASQALACPMCKLANESKQGNEAENLRPKAYMYSILFMLSMPATLTAGFSIAFYRLWKKGQEQMEQADLSGTDEPMA